MSNENIIEELKITEENLNRFFELKEKIDERAEELLKEINTIKKIEGYSHLNVRSMDSHTIDFYGEEYYCGSRDSYEYSIPTYLLYDIEGKEKYMQRIRDEEEEKLRKIEENKRKEQEYLEKREKSLLAELKNKYEGSNK